MVFNRLKRFLSQQTPELPVRSGGAPARVESTPAHASPATEPAPEATPVATPAAVPVAAPKPDYACDYKVPDDVFRKIKTCQKMVRKLAVHGVTLEMLAHEGRHIRELYAFCVRTINSLVRELPGGPPVATDFAEKFGDLQKEFHDSVRMLDSIPDLEGKPSLVMPRCLDIQLALVVRAAPVALHPLKKTGVALKKENQILGFKEQALTYAQFEDKVDWLHKTLEFLVGLHIKLRDCYQKIVELILKQQSRVQASTYRGHAPEFKRPAGGLWPVSVPAALAADKPSPKWIEYKSKITQEWHKLRIFLQKAPEFEDYMSRVSRRYAPWYKSAKLIKDKLGSYNEHICELLEEKEHAAVLSTFELFDENLAVLKGFRGDIDSRVFELNSFLTQFMTQPPGAILPDTLLKDQTYLSSSIADLAELFSEYKEKLSGMHSTLLRCDHSSAYLWELKYYNSHLRQWKVVEWASVEVWGADSTGKAKTDLLGANFLPVLEWRPVPSLPDLGEIKESIKGFCFEELMLSEQASRGRIAQESRVEINDIRRKAAAKFAPMERARFAELETLQRTGLGAQFSLQMDEVQTRTFIEKGHLLAVGESVDRSRIEIDHQRAVEESARHTRASIARQLAIEESVGRTGIQERQGLEFLETTDRALTEDAHQIRFHRYRGSELSGRRAVEKLQEQRGKLEAARVARAAQMVALEAARLAKATRRAEEAQRAKVTKEQKDREKIETLQQTAFDRYQRSHQIRLERLQARAEVARQAEAARQTRAEAARQAEAVRQTRAEAAEWAEAASLGDAASMSPNTSLDSTSPASSSVYSMVKGAPHAMAAAAYETAVAAASAVRAAPAAAASAAWTAASMAWTVAGGRYWGRGRDESAGSEVGPSVEPLPPAPTASPPSVSTPPPLPGSRQSTPPASVAGSSFSVVESDPFVRDDVKLIPIRLGTHYNPHTRERQPICMAPGAWVTRYEGRQCASCRKDFTRSYLATNRHHCRLCGDVFCETCCQPKVVTIPRPWTLTYYVKGNPVPVRTKPTGLGDCPSDPELSLERVCEACVKPMIFTGMGYRDWVAPVTSGAFSTRRELSQIDEILRV